MRRVTLHLNLKPMPRPRVNRAGGVGFPAAYRQHLAILRQSFQIFRELEAPAYRVIVMVYKPVSNTSRAFGDADNLAKTVLEALPFDDSRVVSLTVFKIQSSFYAFTVEVHEHE